MPAEADVFPARAGMIRFVIWENVSGARIPRESGDDPPWCRSEIPPPRYSPRERG